MKAWAWMSVRRFYMVPPGTVKEDFYYGYGCKKQYVGYQDT